MAYGESNGHVTDDVTCPERSNRDPDRLRIHCRKNSGSCYLATIANIGIAGGLGLSPKFMSTDAHF